MKDATLMGKGVRIRVIESLWTWARSNTTEEFAGRLTPSPSALWPLLAVAVSVGCGGTTDTTDDATGLGTTVRILLEPEVVNLSALGESVQMTATQLNNMGEARTSGLPVVWTVSDSNIATLTSSRLLTAVRAGTTEVRVRVNIPLGADPTDTSQVIVAAGARRYTMAFETEFLDLDGDTVITCANSCTFPPGADAKIVFDPDKAVHSVVEQNQTANVRIAYIDGGVFNDVTSATTQAATFTTALVDRAFERNLVILIQTDQGATFKLGNPVAAEWVIDGITFDTGLVQ